MSGIPSTSETRTRLFWLALIIVPVVCWMAIHPLGYIGGGKDDWRYLRAAMCWVDNGPCLPAYHWDGRWVTVLPLAAVIELFGMERWAAAIPSILLGIGSLFLIARIADGRGGKPIGLMTAALFAAVPAFSIRWADPNVDYPELFFLLASFAAVEAYRTSHKRWLALAAGIAFGLAFLSRETALIAAPLLALAAWRYARRDAWALVLAAGGALAPVLVEWAIYAIWAGDPWYRLKLSYGHTLVASTNLDLPAEASRRPILNLEYLRSWKLSPGIDIHWLVNAPINLIFNGGTGASILFNLFIAPIAWRRLDPTEKSAAKLALAIGLYWAFAIIYVVAVYPGPRMMLVGMAAFCFILALQLRALWRSGSRELAAVALAALIFVSVAIPLQRPAMASAERAAQPVLAALTGKVEADEHTLVQLAFFDGLPDLARSGAGRPYLLTQLSVDCSQWADEFFPGKLRTINQFVMTPFTPKSLSNRAHLCLFAYQEPIDPAAIDEVRTGY